MYNAFALVFVYLGRLPYLGDQTRTQCGLAEYDPV